MKVTRRSLVQGLAAVAATTAVMTPAGAQGPARPTAEEDLRAAREDLKDNARRIAQVPLAMSVEPAFHFKA
jgi:hypothetical protein